MVLYSVITTYHLLEAIIHKLQYNREEESILFISHWLKNKYEWYQSLKAFFDKIIVFNADYKYSDDVEEQLKEYFEIIFNENDILVSDIDQIHVFGAEHSFGAYIFTQKISNYFWEEGAGALSKKESMLELFEKSYGHEKAVFQYETHLGDGETDFVNNRFYDKYYQLKEVDGDNLIHFDIAEELKKLDSYSRNRIIELFYGNEKILSDDSYGLILTEHFANLSVMTWEEQTALYKYLVDYFMGDYKLLFKPHPDDTMYYEYIFPESQVIRKKFPAELLPYIFDRKPGIVATSSSTSIYGLRNQFNHYLEFNFEFSHQKQFYKLNRFFVGLSIADKYIKQGYDLYLLGVNASIVDNFCKFQKLCSLNYIDLGDVIGNIENTDFQNHAIWIVDEIFMPHENSEKICKLLDNISGNDIVIFINSDEQYCFYDYKYKSIWNNVYPIAINITALADNDNSVSFAGPSINENRTEMLYIFCKGERPYMYEMKRELPNVGISVTTEEFNGDKLQIKLLEGMLEATEKRLLYYINKEKENSNQ